MFQGSHPRQIVYPPSPKEARKAIHLRELRDATRREQPAKEEQLQRPPMARPARVLP